MQNFEHTADTPGSVLGLTRDTAWAAHGNLLSGNREVPVLLLCNEQPNEATQTALTGALRALGYGPDPCTFLLLSDLDERSLFSLTEALDPLCLVLLDRPSVERAERAYRCTISPDTVERVFGRPCCSLVGFAEALVSSEEKQRMWARLKRLPRPKALS